MAVNIDAGQLVGKVYSDVKKEVKSRILSLKNVE